MKYAMLLMLAMFGCATDALDGPVVYVVGDDVDAAIEGVSAWEPIGFYATADDPGLPECGRHAYDGGDPCQITVAVFRDPRLLELAHTNGMSDRTHRTIWVDAAVDAYATRYTLAHEFGHILLDTATHTHGGIMGASTYWMIDVDYELACIELGRGCK